MKRLFQKLFRLLLTLVFLLNTIWAGVALAENETFPVNEGDIVIDNSEDEYVVIYGNWTEQKANPQNIVYVPPGASVRYLQAVPNRPKDMYVEYKPKGEKALEPGHYDVYLSVFKSSALCDRVPIKIFHNNDYSIVYFNMKNKEPTWHKLGTFYFIGDGNEYVRITNADTPTSGNNHIVADAVKFVKNDQLPPEEPKLNANLSNLSIEPGELGTMFDPAVTIYQVSVEHKVDNIAITATVSESVYTSLTINELPAVSGEPFPVALDVGLNEIPVVVTADNGEIHTEKTYLIMVDRQKDNDARLCGLTVDSYELLPAFAPDIYEYNLSEGEITADSITVTANVYSPVYQKLTIQGVAAESGIPATVPLVFGKNEIPVEITAQSGDTLVYTIIIYRASIPGDVFGKGGQPDGRVSLADLAYVAMHYGAGEDNPDWMEIQRADFNSDKKIDVEDLAYMASLLMK